MVIGGLANQRDHLVPNRGLRRLAARHLQIELHRMCGLRGGGVRWANEPREVSLRSVWF
jgi:hypothetical protein